MTVKSGSTWFGSFDCKDGTGALSTPSVGPVGVLYIDGIINAASVTITGSNPYKWAVTLPSLNPGQTVEIYITATIASIATGSYVASDQADTSLISDVKSDSGAIKLKTDNLPLVPAAVGDAMTLTSGERTAIANEVESQIIDDTDSEKVLQAIVDKIASVNPSLDDLTLLGIASAIRTELATELGRIDEPISSRLAAASYVAPSNSDISSIKERTDRIPDIPSAVGSQMTLTSDYDNAKADILTPLTAAGSLLDGLDELSNAIKLVVDDLATDPAKQSELAELISSIPVGVSINDILTMIVDGELDFVSSIKLWNAALLGKLSGGGTDIRIFRNPDDTVDRIITEIDPTNGDRLNQTYNLEDE